MEIKKYERKNKRYIKSNKFVLHIIKKIIYLFHKE